MINLDSSPTTRWAIHFLALVAVVVVLMYGRVMLIPVVIALMLTSALWPPVRHLTEHWRFPRTLASLTVILGVVGVILLALAWSGLMVQAIILELPPAGSWFPAEAPMTPPDEGTTGEEPAAPVVGTPSPYQRLQTRVAEISPWLAHELFPPDPRQSLIYQNIAPALDQEGRRAPEYIKTVSEQTLFILFLTLFLLIEGDFLMRKTAELFGPSQGPDSKAAITALKNMAKQVRSYLIWRTVINVYMGIALGLIYQFVLGMHYPWLWAILAAVLAYVPYIGPAVAFVPTFFDALLSPGGIAAAIAVLIIYSLILLAEGYIVFPLVIGRSMEMNATTVLLGCLFWGLVWGYIGLFLAMPLMGGIKAICQSVPGWEPWANLMGMEPLSRQHASFFRKLGLGWLGWFAAGTAKEEAVEEKAKVG
jgi:predicted PurR-regulated permease PerM